MAFDVRTNNFEGSFELLFHLIEVNKMDIRDIPISELTSQYIEYIQLNRYEMDNISDFLVMAATLLEIKSQVLLAAREDGEDAGPDPRERLAEMLETYRKYKLLALELKEREVKNKVFVYRETGGYSGHKPAQTNLDLNSLLDGITLERLYTVFADLTRRRELSLDPVRAAFGQVRREVYTVSDKIRELTEIFKLQKRVDFSRLIAKVSCPEEGAALFLAVLELIKRGQILARQKTNFAEITLSAVKTG